MDAERGGINRDEKMETAPERQQCESGVAGDGYANQKADQRVRVVMAFVDECRAYGKEDEGRLCYTISNEVLASQDRLWAECEVPRRVFIATNEESGGGRGHGRDDYSASQSATKPLLSVSGGGCVQWEW